MAYQIVPLDACDDQEIYVTVCVGGNNLPLILRIRWNETGGFFIMRVTDGQTGSVLLDSVPLVTGLAPSENLLSPYEHMGIGEAILMPVTEKAADGMPDVGSFGQDYLLLWGDGL